MRKKRAVNQLLLFIVLFCIGSQGLSFGAAAEPIGRYLIDYRLEGQQKAMLTNGKWPTDGEIVINQQVSVVNDSYSNILMRFSDRRLEHVERDGKIALSKVISKQLVRDLLQQKVASFIAQKGRTVKIAILDSGISAAQAADFAGSACVVAGASHLDDNGNGSRLAGIVADYFSDANQSNEQFSPLLELYGVKLLDASGEGHYSHLLRALDWVEANQIDIVITAFDAKSYSAILADSFDRATARGVMVLSLGDCNALTDRVRAEVTALPKDDSHRLSTAQQQANALYIYRQLSDCGWTKQAVAGLLGNIQRESQLNPAAWQRQDNTKLGYGLVQWDDGADFLEWQGGAIKNRQLTVSEVNQLARDAAATLIDMELEYLVWSSQGQLAKRDLRWLPTTRFASPYKLNYREYIQSSASAAELALVFHASYERSSDNRAQLNQRVDYANAWYQFLLSK